MLVNGQNNPVKNILYKEMFIFRGNDAHLQK